ncbi:NPCBM/NEW2 domain-containing protein [bacterium]|nr:NPCBM/NEW2 domain-containing protein [bacterium]
MPRQILILLIALFTLVSSYSISADVIRLADMDLSKMSCGWSDAKANQSVEGNPLRIHGREFSHGVGTHANSRVYVQLDGAPVRFTAWVGVDDESQGKGSVEFQIYADGEKIYSSGVLKGGEPAKQIDIEISDTHILILAVIKTEDGANDDHADWCEAEFHYKGRTPYAINSPVEEPYLLTPKPGPAPELNNARVYGCRPGHPFLYRIPCTGTRPMSFEAEGLPDSITLDAETGILKGTAPSEPGDYDVVIHAKNNEGHNEREFIIKVGETLALTPPMGWNHWYTFYNRVSQDLFIDAAKAMVDSGMADYGYQYVNIDDCWMMKPGSDDPNLAGEMRGPGVPIRPNKYFPDIKAMCGAIHAMGLKTGTYTSPGPRTCAGYEGSFQNEAEDARQIADWGFDFLKYDWCSYRPPSGGSSLEDYKKPYQLMGDLLKKQDRDILLNLCQYGMKDVWTWGGDVGGQCWRTTGDLGLEGASNLPGFYEIGFSNAAHYEYAAPGRWNDPDYILIGYVGNAFKQNEEPIYTKLTPSEQYSYMSMWCLMAAPLFYSGDITRLNEFTLNVLCNPDVIEIDQDPLGIQGKILYRDELEMVMAKPMQDGSLAVGLFNLSEVERQVEANWKLLGLEGKQRVRDLWRRDDAGTAYHKISAKIRRHGVKLVRLWPAN